MKILVILSWVCSVTNVASTALLQQEMLKEMFAELEDKSYGEQEVIKKKWTAQQKDLYERYQVTVHIIMAHA